MAIAVALMAAAAANVPALGFAPAVRLAPGPATLGQLADLSVLPPELRAQAAALSLAVVGAAPAGGDLDAKRLAARARALMPALEPWTREVSAGRVQVTLLAPSDPPRAPRRCARLEAPLARGEAPTPADFAAADCGPGAIAGAFSFSVGDGLARMRRDLRAGDLVADPPLAAMAALRPGAPAQIAAQVGPVRIERAVEVVRAARPGATTFVRTQDGRVFAAEPERVRP